ncbi:MAG: hypothetical protein DRJ61_18105 [Acidobacteria bacterium]|nr:MAG: hypothetical protein DRJ61_18105 [Acidobacteriota bacterium]
MRVATTMARLINDGGKDELLLLPCLAAGFEICQPHTLSEQYSEEFREGLDPASPGGRSRIES